MVGLKSLTRLSMINSNQIPLLCFLQIKFQLLFFMNDFHVSGQGKNTSEEEDQNAGQSQAQSQDLICDKVGCCGQS